MKILLKNATLLPEYGYGSRRVSVLVKDKKKLPVSPNSRRKRHPTR